MLEYTTVMLQSNKYLDLVDLKAASLDFSPTAFLVLMTTSNCWGGDIQNKWERDFKAQSLSERLLCLCRKHPLSRPPPPPPPPPHTHTHTHTHTPHPWLCGCAATYFTWSWNCCDSCKKETVTWRQTISSQAPEEDLLFRLSSALKWKLWETGVHCVDILCLSSSQP